MSALATSDVILLPAEIEARLLNLSGEMLVLPSTATQTLELAEDPDCSLIRFASIIERDPQLTGEILKLSNSVLYGRTDRVGSVHQAVARLGLRTATNLVMASCIASLMKKVSLEDEWTRDSLAMHAQLTATVSALLNRKFRLGFHGEEFTAGLMHDIGRMMLAMTLPDRFQEFDSLSFDEPDDIEYREVQAIGVSHTQVGCWYAQKNRFPESLQSAVLYHHSPGQATAHPRLALLIAAADRMANAIQLGEDPQRYDLATNPNLTQLLLPTFDLQTIQDEVVAIMTEASQLMNQ